jgi:alanyl-tRNA synthetase
VRTSDLRKLFLDFFRSKEHYIEPSASLVPPPDDKSLLLINAGMAPLKPYFLGLGTPPSTRIASCQRCLRTNDIDEVGRTPRHLTCFEMLGNFSFGDYFKKEIIVWSWEFVREWLKIPEDRLRVSVHEKDDEAYGLWEKEVGVRRDWIYRLGDNDNFWFMAETGPCGPDSEIFYDLGEELGPDRTPETGGDRWVEIWNLVFTQFDRQSDGTLKPLPKKNVDTGMGLERTAMALQGETSVFETDLFKPIIDIFRELTPKEILDGKSYTRGGVNSFYVVSDHSRAVFMLIADGVFPGNEGRGYVLRRLLRRALVHLRRLGQHEGGLLKAFPIVLDMWGSVYPNLVERREHIERLVTVEEENFLRTLDAGVARLESAIEAQKGGSMLPGEVAFEMFDTYGVPLDVTVEMAQAHSIDVDQDGFHRALDKARHKARSARKHKVTGSATAKGVASGKEKVTYKTEFIGYNTLRETSEFLQYNTEENYVVTRRTPFYAEMGGQVGDTGKLLFDGGEFTVIDTRQVGQMTIQIIDPQKTIGDPSKLKPGDPVEAHVDSDRRKAIKRAHTATHLLHAALRAVLGDHVQQAGSVVEPDRLRFDFSHYQPVSKDELRKIEDHANERVFAEHPVFYKTVPIDEARKAGAMALFGEKYGDEVRMVWVGGRETEPVKGQVESTELCGGTHVDNTGVIGMIRIISEESVASGVRRIEAVTGRRAYEEARKGSETLESISTSLHLPIRDLQRGIEKLTDQVKKLEKEKKDLENRLVSGQTAAQAEELTIGKVRAVIFPPQELPADAVAKMLDDKAETDGAVVAFAVTEYDGKGTLLVRCSDGAVKAGFKAGELIKKAAEAMGGRGGGKPTFARGGVDASKYNQGRDAFVKAVREIAG